MRKIIISAALFTVFSIAASEQACTIKSNCPHRNEVCHYNKCVAKECSSMSDCAPYQVCSPPGICKTAATDAPPCKSNGDCKNLTKCKRGKCEDSTLIEEALFGEYRPLLE